jgi:hypothetical protein
MSSKLINNNNNNMITVLNNTNKWDPLIYLDQLMNHFLLVTSTLDADIPACHIIQPMS